MATIGQSVLIATPAAQRLLAGVDHAELWEQIGPATRLGRSLETTIDRPSSQPLVLRCRPLHHSGGLEGAGVEFVADQRPAAPQRSGRRHEQLGDLVGVSEAWQAVVHESLLVAQLDESVLIVGERGTGRFSVARAIAERNGSQLTTTFDSAAVLTDGPRVWLRRVRAAMEPDATIIVRRIDQLTDDVAAALASIVVEADDCRVMATSTVASSPEPGLAALLDQLNVLQIDLPPLRNRRHDIPQLVNHLAGHYGHPEVNQSVLNVLYRQRWPGNVTELRQALRSACAKARTERMGVHHLPLRLRQEKHRMPLHGLRQQEADAIVAAIRSTKTRTEAAEQLGISRATLFRRIKAYGLDTDID